MHQSMVLERFRFYPLSIHHFYLFQIQIYEILDVRFLFCIYFSRFYGLTERMSRMEATIGPILNKVDSVLERIDDMKKAKKKKRETIQRLMETIEDNEGCK